jgi:hypothetical protein
MLESCAIGMPKYASWELSDQVIYIYIFGFGYFWNMGESESPLEWFGKHLNMEVVGFLGRQDRRPEDTHGLRQMVNYVNIKNAIETHGSGGIKYTHMNGSCSFSCHHPAKMNFNSVFDPFMWCYGWYGWYGWYGYWDGSTSNIKPQMIS